MKMSIHKVICEINLLDKKINDAIANKSVPFAINNKSGEKYLGQEKEVVEKAIQSRFDKINGLIERRSKLRKLRDISNATTKKEVCGKEYLICELIQRKESINYEKNLLRVMIADLSSARAAHTKQVEEFDNRLERYLATVLTGTTHTKDDISVETERFKDREKWEIIDPLGLEKKIGKLKEEIENFEAEVDAALSESNATTFIEIEDEE